MFVKYTYLIHYLTNGSEGRLIVGSRLKIDSEKRIVELEDEMKDRYGYEKVSIASFQLVSKDFTLCWIKEILNNN